MPWSGKRSGPTCAVLRVRKARERESIAKASQRNAITQGADLDAKTKEIESLVRAFDTLPAKDRNEIVREIVKECTWDSETLFLRL